VILPVTLLTMVRAAAAAAALAAADLVAALTAIWPIAPAGDDEGDEPHGIGDDGERVGFREVDFLDETAAAWS
jgi:hypothetical protein